jgi:hypothetical protein
MRKCVALPVSTQNLAGERQYGYNAKLSARAVAYMPKTSAPVLPPLPHPLIATETLDAFPLVQRDSCFSFAWAPDQPSPRGQQRLLPLVFFGGDVNIRATTPIFDAFTQRMHGHGWALRDVVVRTDPKTGARSWPVTFGMLDGDGQPCELLMTAPGSYAATALLSRASLMRMLAPSVQVSVVCSGHWTQCSPIIRACWGQHRYCASHATSRVVRDRTWRGSKSATTTHSIQKCNFETVRRS